MTHLLKQTEMSWNMFGIKLSCVVRKKKRLVAAVTIGLIMIFLMVGSRQGIVVKEYIIDSGKVVEPIKVAVVADLHSSNYGEKQKALMMAIKEVSPDVIVLIGDIVDDVLPRDKAIEFFEGIADKYPCYYVSGNHEYWSGDIEGIKSLISSYGIIVLEGERQMIEVNGQKINLSGIDDPEIGEEKWLHQLMTVDRQIEEEIFSVLLTHRPERIEQYNLTGFDLVLAGHAHGGQWRIPGLLNGLVAPDQGLFPEYAGGTYEFDHQTMIVSRGLARESTRVPRLYNPTELVIVTIK